MQRAIIWQTVNTHDSYSIKSKKCIAIVFDKILMLRTLRGQARKFYDQVQIIQKIWLARKFVTILKI